MTHVIIDSKELNLPEEFAKKLKSRKVELVETEEGILIRSVTDAVQRAKGFLKGSNFTLDKYLVSVRKRSFFLLAKRPTAGFGFYLLHRA